VKFRPEPTATSLTVLEARIQPGGRAARQVIVSLTLTGKEHVHSIPIWKDRLPLALGAASLLAELRMNNEQRNDSEAELYSGPFGVAFALSVLITAAAVLWLF
jgi:hypothetical protein